MMRAAAPALIFLLLAFQPTRAGAWTLDQGQVQVISGTVASRATRRFDRSTPGKIVFDKLFVQNWAEYGLTDSVTLLAAPEVVMASFDMDGKGMEHTRAASVEGGVRILLLSRIGMLSAQMSLKTAGAFDMSSSAGSASGQQFELRLLYGREFRLFRHNGYFDMEVAERWIRRPRPNEMAIDATAALWLSPKYLLMLQSFNTIAGGGAEPPYAYYRQDKLQLSLLRRLSKRWSLQTGAFFSPAGDNIVQEQGVAVELWFQY